MLGDGIRRNIATVTKEERDRFAAAILKLNDGTMTYSDGRTFFEKQEWIHFAGHSLAHAGAAFMGWHRELINRFEVLLRLADAELSLHYWDWTTDPRDQIDSDGNHFSLFTPDFMGDDGQLGTWTAGAEGSATNPDWGGEAAPPFDNFKTIVSGQTYPELGGGTPDPPSDHADLPSHKLLWRAVGPEPSGTLKGSAFGGPFDKSAVGATAGPPKLSTVADAAADKAVAPDNDVLTSADGLAQTAQFATFLKNLGGGHNYIHQYLNGSMGTEHVSLADPFFFLMHSNLDRLWAMWQRAVVGGVPQSWRLDPNQTYGTQNGSLNDSFPPWDGTPGIILPTPLRPWDPNIAPSGGDLLDPGHVIVSKTAKHPTVISPHSYDTAPHSSYIITNRDTFSDSEVTAKGTPAVFQSAFYVIYEGFAPKELGATSSLPTVPPNLPTITFGGASNITATNPTASYENPSGTIDMPQRITISYDLSFANANDFPATVIMEASLDYDVDTGTGGSTVALTEVATALLVLIDQPNPYMLDIDASAQNPYWLSFDTRVFQVTDGDTILGATQGSDPFGFLQDALTNLRATPSKFETDLSADEDASVLELSQKVGGKNVFNYAVARVRYLAPAQTPATDVQVFFRVFSTLVSALDYDSTSASAVAGNYRRTGNTSGSMPLLGIQTDQSGNGEVASFPCFAEARIANMSNQTDGNNKQTINGGDATEQEAFFGCWLDINQTDTLFPRDPLADTGGPNGPFTGSGGGSLQSIQTLITGHHQCMVAEIFFWPSGTVSDPIHSQASPSSSDRLAQRNLSIVPSSNPGWPDAHTIQHTFTVKPSVIPITQPAGTVTRELAATQRSTKRGKRTAGTQDAVAQNALPSSMAAAAVGRSRYQGPDELIIRWNNVPRDSTATIYFPEVEADEILALSALRQHPQVLTKLDAHTLACQLADVTFVPLPGGRKGTVAGLLSLTLPPKVRTGQVFKLSVEQYSGYTLKTLGAFQITIPVRTDAQILPNELRKYSVLRYVQETIPVGNRWFSIFQRYLGQIAARIRGLGGDPNAVKPSPDGGEGAPPVCPPHKVHEICPADLFCLNIPWKECDIEGEIDLKLRFRRKCK